MKSFPIIRNPVIATVLIILVGILLISILSYANYSFVTAQPGGEDFYNYWMGSRLFLVQGISPYSTEAAEAIQNFYYGRLAGKGEYAFRLFYPLYNTIIFFPLSLIRDGTVARATWMTILELAALASLFLSIRISGWRSSCLWLLIFIPFGLFSYHTVRPVIVGNISPLVTLLILCGFWALRNGGDELAGLLFGLTAIKPGLVVLLLIYLVFWSIIQKRWRLFGWIIITCFLLASIASLLLPNWILQNTLEILRNFDPNVPSSISSILSYWFPAMGNRIGWVVSGAFLLLILIEWWVGRYGDFRSLYWTACFTLTITQMIGIPTDPVNFFILIPGVALVFSVWEERWDVIGRTLIMVSMIILFFGIWFLFWQTTADWLALRQSSALFFPLPIFLMTTLLWVRWWAIRPPNVWFDLIMSQENPQ